jgi:hypothetical protein
MSLAREADDSWVVPNITPSFDPSGITGGGS